jgi:hypothetical protein
MVDRDGCHVSDCRGAGWEITGIRLSRTAQRQPGRLTVDEERLEQRQQFEKPPYIGFRHG